MKKRSCDPEQNVFGIGPLGGNSVEGTGNGMAAVRDTDVQGVPLRWDPRAQSYISEQAIEELDDRDASIVAREGHRREQEFVTKAGVRRS